MDGERISLRLEPEDLELLDAFIEKHPEYSNRSNFARVAIRSFIEQFEGTKTNEITKNVKSNVITIEVPRFAHETIMSSVRAGIYNSPEEAIVECVRKRYINIEEAIENIKREKLENLKGTVQMVPD
ncbi:MAG: ribbon-helix-helix domain-containing protein [Methanomassiliicoccus sp.]|nr:ribbon-helix-helix domain-containing protein [Methanomassiliicoccus sp.]